MPLLRRYLAGRSAIALAIAFLLGTCPWSAAAHGAKPGGPELIALWEHEVRPLLNEHCTRCHGAVKRSGELSLRSITDLLQGGDRGPAIDHDDPQASWLLAVLQPDSDPHMPPEQQLDDEAIGTLRRWVESAAALQPAELAALGTKASSAAAEKAQTPDAGAAGYPQGVEPRLVIDLAVQAGWQAAETPIAPAGLCDDSTFVRRLYLDLLGRVPTFSEREQFLAESSSDKRDRLIDRLLASSEHAQHMSEWFDTILMGRGSVATMKRRAQHGWKDFLTAAFAENRPWNETARQIVLARPASPEEAGASWYLYERKDQYQQIAEAVSAGFFGVDIQCAQCHDHPLANEIAQAHYWGLVAFFNRSKNTDTPAGPRVAEAAIGGFSMFTNLEGESQANRLVYLLAAPVEEPRPAEGQEQEDRDDLYEPAADGQPPVPKFSRREQFADHVLGEHPLLARAMVNRLWALMMGRGIVHPVDQLDSTHPPSHPELLQWLSDDFERSGYDVRRMLAQIVRSDTYQLASESDSFVDPARFAVAASKPLTAEVLYRAMLVALDVEDLTRWQTAERLAEIRQAFPDLLADVDVARVDQALLLSNGALIHELLSTEHSRTLGRLAKLPSASAVADAAFIEILGRPADEEERGQVVAFLETRSELKNRGIDQLIWSLLTSAEFRFNH